MNPGYSGTPLPKKLGLKAGSRLRLLGAPDGFSLEDSDPFSLTDEVFDVAIAFCMTPEDVVSAFDALIPDIDPKGGIWIAWPKKTSGIKTGLGDGPVRELGLATGLVDNKVCAIDETWSGLRFVVRLKDRI